MDRQAKERELNELRNRVELLEIELGMNESEPWRTNAYPEYDATSGFLLGFIPAVVSLLANLGGSYVMYGNDPNHHPLKLIQVYLTFPMGEKALSLSSGLTLTIGCFLYIITGMFYGMFMQVIFSKFFANASVGTRIVMGILMGTLIWFVNFYLILSWLQPALLGGNWIVETIPPWVAWSTHALFGAVMAVVYPLGKFQAYQKLQG